MKKVIGDKDHDRRAKAKNYRQERRQEMARECWQIFYFGTMSSVEGEPLVSEILGCWRGHTNSICAHKRCTCEVVTNEQSSAWRRPIRVARWGERGWVEAKTIGAWSMVARYDDEDMKASRKTWSVVCKLKRRTVSSEGWLGGKKRSRVRSRRVRRVRARVACARWCQANLK